MCSLHVRGPGLPRPRAALIIRTHRALNSWRPSCAGCPLASRSLSESCWSCSESRRPAEAQKKTLVVALNQDPDILDPSLARTYVGRIVFASICEKLYEIDETLHIHPQLAAELPRFTDGGKTVTIKLRPGVKFNDGTPMNAEAVQVLAGPPPDDEGLEPRAASSS